MYACANVYLQYMPRTKARGITNLNIDVTISVDIPIVTIQ